jgi:hypothetical protein
MRYNKRLRDRESKRAIRQFLVFPARKASALFADRPILREYVRRYWRKTPDGYLFNNYHYTLQKVREIVLAPATGHEQRTRRFDLQPPKANSPDGWFSHRSKRRQQTEKRYVQWSKPGRM